MGHFSLLLFKRIDTKKEWKNGVSPLFSENVKNNTDHQINNSKILPNTNFWLPKSFTFGEGRKNISQIDWRKLFLQKEKLSTFKIAILTVFMK